MSSNLTRPRGLALDAEEGLLYWTDQVTRLFMSEVTVQDFFIIITHYHCFGLITSSVADPGGFFRDRGSDFSIGSRIQGLKGTGDPGSATKNLIIFNPKTFY